MPELLRVSDPDDLRIAAFRDIRERDLVGRRGLFVAEGTVVLNVLAGAAAFEPVSMLVLENRLDGLADLLGRMPAGLPVHVADATVMDAIAGFPMHRGVLAIGRRRLKESPDDLLASLPERALILVLVGISNHDNVGAIFRNAAAFGVDAVLLDPTCADPLYRRSVRVSLGHVLRVPFARLPAWPGSLARLRDAGWETVALTPSGDVDLDELVLRAPDRVALLLGAEGPGLTDDVLAAADHRARISLAPGVDSLNVATAAAVALHALRRFGNPVVNDD
jgi:tRNA G18 (ribose-2'-O)-methylase SpoU